MSFNALTTNQKLTVGESLVSNNGNWRATFQGNGDFVIFKMNRTWNSNSECTDGSHIIMQGDGNVVIYNKYDQPRWATDTYIPGAQMDCRFELTNDGDLVLTQDGKRAWTSANSAGYRKC